MGEKAGWAIEVHPSDHPPPHVHCWRDGIHVVVVLGEELKIDYRTKRRPKKGDSRRLLEHVVEKRDWYVKCYYNAIRRHAA